MELKEVAQEASIKIGAEAYSIDVNVVYPDEEFNGLDFGLVKVVDDVSKEFTVENTGKYEVGFKLSSRTQKMRDLFTITPEQGTIEPGSTETITLHFNEHHTLKKETTLKGNADITLAIIEELTGNKESVIPVKVDLRAVFCKYSILPARGLNFGPVIYDTESNPKVFDLTNSGEFPFEFNLTSYGDDEGTEAKVEGSSLLLGNFTVTPNAGTVEPGSVEQISVTFKAEKSRTYAELMSIDVTDRDPADHPGGIQYEIAGESCIPGINAEDVESIFEEHVVVAALDPFNAQSCVFAKREKCFDFGAVIANVSEDTDEALGVTSNLKISNPNKVPCTVNFSVRARGEGEVPVSDARDGLHPSPRAPVRDHHLRPQGDPGVLRRLRGRRGERRGPADQVLFVRAARRGDPAAPGPLAAADVQRGGFPGNGLRACPAGQGGPAARGAP